MTLAELHKIAEAMTAPGKGILAADESTGTIKRRFDAIGVESTADTRRDYRELLFRSSERLAEYRGLGAKFAKWRAVIDIGSGIPSYNCIKSNAHALARYAALCQEEDIVPIVEPEVLMDGDHDIDRCQTKT